MKKLLFFILLLFSITSFSQTKGYFRYDTIVFEKPGGNAEFNLRNRTRDSAGVLTNIGGGRTAFRPVSAIADSSQFATQYDITTNRTVIPTFFDTIERKKIYDGVALTEDFQHPTLLRTETGKILVGGGAAHDHAFGGVTVYGVSLTQGLTWSPLVYVETDTSYHYRNGIFSQRGDTITLTYWSAINGRIYIRTSTNDWVSYSSRDSITSAIPLATENRILQWKGYNIMDVYTYTIGTDNIDSAGIAYKTSLSGGVWNFSWIQDLRGLQLDEGKFIVRNDTLFGFIRSDTYQDSLYIVYKTSIAGAWSVPFGVRVPHWDAGKPEIIVMDDGRMLMNYRTTLPGTIGMYAISSDNGYTWDSVYNAGGTLYVYGSTLYMGDDTYMNVSSEGIPPYGNFIQLYFHIPRLGLTNSGEKTFESIGRPYDIMEHIWNQKDSVASWKYGVGAMNIVPIGTGVQQGLRILNNSSAASIGITHINNYAVISRSSAAAPTVYEQIMRFYESTATGTDVIMEIGDNTDPFFRMYQGGTIRTTKPFLNTGSGLFRIENSGGGAPFGATGVGHEFFVAGGIAYWNPLNRTSIANAPIEIISSAIGITGTTTIKSVLNLNPGVPLQLNGSAGTAGQVLTSAGAGALPTWGAGGGGGVTTMQAIGSTPNANGATISGSDLNLQPYSASFGGVTTTGAQTGAGDKTWSGEAKFTNQFLTTGNGLFRIESNGSGVPAGSTGPGFEFFTSGGTSYLSAYNRTSSSYTPLYFFGSAITFNGASSFLSSLNLGAGVPLTLNGAAGTAGQYLKSLGAGVLPEWSSRVISVLNSQYTDVANVTTGEDDLQTYTIPAGQLSVDGDIIEFTMSFILSTANLKTVRLKFGTTSMDVYQNTLNTPYVITGTITRAGATVQRLCVSGTGSGVATYADVVSTSETLSGTLVLKCTGEGVATNDIIQRQMVVKFLPAN